MRLVRCGEVGEEMPGLIDADGIIRDLTGLSDRIKIESVGDDLIFSCVGPFAKSRIFRTEQKDSNDLIDDKIDAKIE